MGHCDFRLTSYEPIVEMLWRCERRYDGWTVWTRHRHYGGLFGDCEAFEWAALSEHELVDVLAAVIVEAGAFQTALEHTGPDS